MKQTTGTCLLAAALLLTVPASVWAQNTQERAEQNRKEVEQTKEQAKQRASAARQQAERMRQDGEQIIITRTGDKDEKTVIEINGDAVIVNGKNVKELKGDVRVQRRRVRDVDALAMVPSAPMPPDAPFGPDVNNFHFEMGENGMNFFHEDSTRPMLGVMTAEDERGARISGVSKESGAEKAGLKTGDIITRIGDEKVEDAEDVTAAVRKHKPGDKVSITYLRDGKEQKTTAQLTPWKGLRINATGDNFRVTVPRRITPIRPNENFRDFYMELPGGRPKLGISIQDTEDGKGVVVQDVDDDSPAAKAGIREGDVITHLGGAAVDDVSDMRRELSENKEKASTTIKLRRNGKEQTVEVKMPRKLKTADL